MDYNEELVTAFVNAAGNAFSSLKETHNEQFYYFAFIFDEGLQPYISAWSYEALEQSMKEQEMEDPEGWQEANCSEWWKWNFSDSPYVDYGYDEYFNEVRALLDKRAERLSVDELYEAEWEIRIDSMEEAMKRLDQSGLFGTKETRKNVVINVESAPPDGSEYKRALRLNPASPLLSEYLQCCETEED